MLIFEISGLLDLSVLGSILMSFGGVEIDGSGAVIFVFWFELFVYVCLVLCEIGGARAVEEKGLIGILPVRDATGVVSVLSQGLFCCDLCFILLRDVRISQV